MGANWEQGLGSHAAPDFTGWQHCRDSKNDSVTGGWFPETWVPAVNRAGMKWDVPKADTVKHCCVVRT